MSRGAPIFIMVSLLICVVALLCASAEQGASAKGRDDSPFDSPDMYALYNLPDVARLYSNQIETLNLDARVVVLYNYSDDGIRKFVNLIPRARVVGVCKYWLGSGPPAEDYCTGAGIEQLLTLPNLELLEISDNYSLDDGLLHKLAWSSSLRRVYLTHCSGFSLQTALTIRPGFFRVTR